MNKDTFAMINRVVRCGIAEDDAWKLRRIAMTLHAWGELECGTDRGAIERDEATGKPMYRYSDGRSGGFVPDRERGALRRLDAIMDAYRHAGLSCYVQSDPRGAPLYVLRPGDVPKGADADSYYSRGIAIHK